MLGRMSSRNFAVLFALLSLQSPTTLIDITYRDPDTDERPYQCQYCMRGFNLIRDALLRHLRTCDRRLRAGLPPPILDHKKRGRRQNACERCAKLKRKCSKSQPCKACADQNQDCKYGQTPPKKNCFTSPPELRKDPILY
ncbi:hypothetical protein DER44DRAFT_433226 [Fusarium oxysporum]|nr:hypothetical protein DER44DRAFT_433226 [Fusarium oxysporum]